MRLLDRLRSPSTFGPIVLTALVILNAAVWVESDRPPTPVPFTSESVLRTALDQVDLNRDGRVTREEYSQYVPLAVFEAVDANRNGELDVAEFYRALHSAAPLRAPGGLVR